MGHPSRRFAILARRSDSCCVGESAFFDGLRMNGEAVNLWKAFFDAVFQGGGDVMDFCDGQRAIHGAMAGDENFVVDAADVHFMAVRHFVILGLQGMQIVLNRASEFLHFFGAGDARTQWFDVNIDERAGLSGEADIILEFRGSGVSLPKARAFVNLQMQFDKKTIVELVRG